MTMLRSIFSSTVVPRALGVISSPRIGSLSITKAALTAEVSDRHFSTDSAQSITRKIAGIINSEIENHERTLKKSMEIPAKLPFTIEDDPSYCHITLRRDFDDEKIEVTVSPVVDDIPKVEVVVAEGSSSSTETSDTDTDSYSESETENEVEEEELSGVPVPVPVPPLDLTVSLIKEEKGTIDIGAYVSADEIVVYRILFTKPNQCYPLLRYDVSDDGGMLQYLLSKFVEIRGIEKDNVGFLYNYTVERRERRRRLEKPGADDLKVLKKFMEDW